MNRRDHAILTDPLCRLHCRQEGGADARSSTETAPRWQLSTEENRPSRSCSVQTRETSRRATPAAAAKARAQAKRTWLDQRRADKALNAKGEWWASATQRASALESHFRHSGWAKQREAIRASLVRTGCPARSLERFDECGSDAWIKMHRDTREVRVFSNTCRCRHCKPCQRQRGNLIASNVLRKITGERAKHIVLTVPSIELPWDQGLEAVVPALIAHFTAIYAAWTRLQKFKLWSPRQRKMVRWLDLVTTGGARFFECEYNSDIRQYHPHFHIVTTARWIPHEALEFYWSCAYGEPCNVWIADVGSAEAVAHEVSKYASKPIDGRFTADPDALDALIIAMRGRRLCQTFGRWSGWRLLQPLEIYDAAKWVNLGKLEDHVMRAVAGDQHSTALLTNIKELMAQCPRPPPIGP